MRFVEHDVRVLFRSRGARIRAKREKKKKRDIHRARVLRRSLVIRLVILLHEYWWQTCSLFVLSKLANRRELYIYIYICI